MIPVDRSINNLILPNIPQLLPRLSIPPVRTFPFNEAPR